MGKSCKLHLKIFVFFLIKAVCPELFSGGSHLASSGFAQWGNMEPPLPPSCSDSAVWGKSARFLGGNHMLGMVCSSLWGCCMLDSLGCCMEGFSSKCGCFHSLAHNVVLLPLHCPVSSEASLQACKGSARQARAWSNLPPQTPPVKQQPAAAWTNTCTSEHCPVFCWNHQGSSSPLHHPTLAVLNTTALCHLVILGKRDCPTR